MVAGKKELKEGNEYMQSYCSDDYWDDIALLDGSVDLHFHSGPSVFPRIFDHAGAVKEATERKLKAVVLKDHYYPTYNDVYFIKKYIHTDKQPIVFGGVALNNSIGGINPHAMDIAVKAEVKIVWMPTVSSKNHIDHHNSQRNNFLFPTSSQKLLIEPSITILDDKGNLKQEVYEVLEIIASNPNIILANGHLSYMETKVLFSQARKMGINKLLVNHPTFLMECSADDLKIFTDQGAFIEHSAGMIHPDSIFYSISIEKLINYIDVVGLESTIISSDLGQIDNPLPAEGMLFVIKALLKNGFKEDDIQRLISKNAASLLEI